MSDAMGALAHNGNNTVADAMDAIFTTSASDPTPPLAPESYDAPALGDQLPQKAEPARTERLFPKASWLDALSGDAQKANAADADRISSVNSDDNGLYRMFIGISP